MTNPWMLALCAGCALAPFAAQAQGAAASSGASAGETSRLEEVVVTARRRAERLQDVPVAVTAVSGAALERKAVVGIQDLNRIAPSLMITQSPGSGRNLFAITIRGQRQADTLPSLDPSVGVYFGDVLFKRLYGLNDILFDLNAVEVLKGPQGTLFGLNVTGGNVIFRPNLPTDRFEGSVELGAGNYNERTLQGFINIPVATGVDLRISGQRLKRDGYIVNVLDGKREQDENSGGLRIALRLQPTADLESLFIGNYVQRDVGGTGHHFDTIRPGSTVDKLYGPAGQTALAFSRSLGYYEVAHNVDGHARTAPAWDIANTTTYHLNQSVTLKNIVGYRRYKADQFDDVDGGPLGILAYGSQFHGDQVSEEFQALGESGRTNWITGAYFLRERVNTFSYTRQLLSPFLDPVQNPYTVNEAAVNTSKSLFASVTENLNMIADGLSLTLGGRYSWDDRKSRFGTVYSIGKPNQRCAFNIATDPNLAKYDFDPVSCRVGLSDDFSNFTYTTSLDYKIASDKLVYFVHRKGYRAGGFSTRGTQSFTFAPFQPEIVNDFELGAKLDWRLPADMFLRTNAAIYHQAYSNIQRNTPTVDPATHLVASVVRNAGKARIDGVELEADFVPSRWFDLSAFASYTEPKYLDFSVPVAPTAANPNPAPLDVTQTASFGGVPLWQTGATGRVNLPTPPSIADTSLELTWYHQSKFISQDRLDFQPEGVVPGYTVWNARLEFNHIAGRPVRVALFANNLLNKKYAYNRNSLASELGFADYTAAPPRMYGVSVRYNFGE